jgi:glutamyl-tRNA(Gln) amidotransferase subunit D
LKRKDIVNSSESYDKNKSTLLNKYNIKIGDSVKIISTKGNYYGIVMPRYESFNDKYLVIKLKSGYNIGLFEENIIDIIIEEPSTTSIVSSSIHSSHFKYVDRYNTFKKSEENKINGPDMPNSLPKILLLSTGGTIASKIDYRTGGVTSILGASELYEIFPEISNYASIYPEFILNEYSENMGPYHWSILSERVSYAILHEHFDGIVISHGTDTIHYTSSALSFALQNLSIPVVLVGSQRSTDRPSSDAFTNLLGAIKFIIKAKFAGVFVCMHHTPSDEIIAIYLGTRVRKNHTSKRNAFQSLDYIPFALVNDNDIVYSMDLKKLNLCNGTTKNFISKTSFDSRVFLLKFYPGFDPAFLEYFLHSEYKVIILEGTGLGHINNNCFSYLEKLINAGIVIFMTSQCMYGRVQLTIYDTGRDLLNLGIIPLDDMSSETAIVKSMWALGNSSNINDLIDMMKINISNEISSISPLVF